MTIQVYSTKTGHIFTKVQNWKDAFEMMKMVVEAGFTADCRRVA